MFQETLNELFPSWEAVRRHREVIIFTSGLLPDPQPLVDHVYDTWIRKELNRMQQETGSRRYSPEVDIDLLRSLYTESTTELCGVWNHNQHINHCGKPSLSSKNQKAYPAAQVNDYLFGT